MLGMGFVDHWSILAVLRAFLGVFEAGEYNFPCCLCKNVGTDVVEQVYFLVPSSSSAAGIVNMRSEKESRSSTWRLWLQLPLGPSLHMLSLSSMSAMENTPRAGDGST